MYSALFLCYSWTNPRLMDLALPEEIKTQPTNTILSFDMNDILPYEWRFVRQQIRIRINPLMFPFFQKSLEIVVSLGKIGISTLLMSGMTFGSKFMITIGSAIGSI